MKKFLYFFFISLATPLFASQRIPLWENPPGLLAGSDTETDPLAPTMDVYLPSEGEERAGVIIFPGGGYAKLSMDYEGVKTAKFLNANGIAAFVVRYRHAPRYRYPIPLDDAQRAVRLARFRSKEFGLDPNRLGVIGFSAGGHLASMVATLSRRENPATKDPVDACSARPDFAILIYPVITLSKGCAHLGSRDNLAGGDPSLWEKLSSERNVTADTPPIFLVHGGADKLVPAENSLIFYLACIKEKVPVELHIFQQGDHGLFEKELAAEWPNLMMGWMRRNKWAF